MASFADRVKVTVDSSTSGTGAVTLSTAVSGYQAVPSALDGASIRYVIELGTAWEIGLGVYTHSSLNLTRSLTSSSTGSLLSLNNTAVVFISPAAEDLQYVEVYSSTSDLPSASSNHGRIAHVHGDGAMYFAHGGSWIRLGNHSDITTYSNATTSAAGLMSSSDKTKLDGVATSANNYTLPTASASTLGGIKIGTGLSIDGSGVVTASGGSSSSSNGSLVPITTTKTTATANQTVFTGTWKAENISVFLNGVKLQDSEVTATDTQITISATAVGDVVEVVEYGAPFASPYASTFPTVTTGATSVTVDYTVDKVAVYKNGVKLRGGGVDFTATNGTSITGFSAFVSGDVVEVVEHGSLAESGGGVTTYANKTAIDAVSSPSEGDLAFDEDKNVLYIRAGSAWERIQHGGNVGPRITTAPAATHSLSATGSTSTITIVATDESGFPVTYDWDGISGTTLYNSSSLPDQVTNVSESNGVFTLTPSSNTSHSGAFTFRTKASDGAQVSTATTTVSLAFAGHLLGFANNISGVTYSSRTSIQGSPAAAFDNSTDQGHNCWHGAAFNTSLKDWLMVDFGSGNAKVVTKYGIAERYSGSSRVTSWKLQGSNDGTTFTDLQSLIVEGVDVSRKIMGYNGHSLNTQSNYLSYFHSFNLTSTTAYRYIRLWVEAAGGGYPVIGEMYIEGY